MKRIALPKFAPISRAGARDEAGFSLIELMISIAIGLMIIAGLIGVLTSNARNSQTNEKTAELQANGRYAMDHLRREVRMAGFLGYTSRDQLLAPVSAINVTGITECGGAGSGFLQNLRQGIWGANGNPFAASCLPNHLRGDVLVLRRVAGPVTKTVGAATVDDCSAPPTGIATVYLRSSFVRGMMYQGTTPPASISEPPCGDFTVVEYVYYIGVDDADASVPALRRVALYTDGSLVDEMVVSGIENLQLQFGRFTTDGNAQYADPNDISGNFNEADTSWKEIKAVRIWLLARNRKVEAGYTNNQVYNLGDDSYAVNDGFRRQVFTSVVHLRN